MISFLVILLLCGGLLAFFATGMDYQLRQISRFQKQRTKGTKGPLSLAELLQQPVTTQKFKVPLSDVRDFVITLQLGTSMEATLSGSLARAADQYATRGIFGERLRKHVEARLSISPDAVLQGLVQEFDCMQLSEVLDRVRMAADGGISYNRVLGVSVAAIEEDIRRNVEQQIQRAPTLLTLPMVGGVFFPALALGLIPLVMFAAAQMK